MNSLQNWSDILKTTIITIVKLIGVIVFGIERKLRNHIMNFTYNLGPSSSLLCFGIFSGNYLNIASSLIIDKWKLREDSLRKNDTQVVKNIVSDTSVITF